MVIKNKNVKEEKYYWAVEKSGILEVNEPEIIYIPLKIFTDLSRLSISRFDHYFADGCQYPNHLVDWKILKEIKPAKGKIADLFKERSKWFSKYGDPQNRYYKNKPEVLKKKDIKKNTYYWALEKARKWDPCPEIVYVYKSCLTRLSVARQDCFFDIDSTCPNHLGDWNVLEEVRFPKTGEVLKYKKKYKAYIDKEYAEIKEDLHGM